MKLPVNISKMYAFGFLKNLHFIGGVLVPFFTIWGKLTLTQVMILQSWFSFWVFLLEAPTGAIADHFGRKVSLALGSFVVAVAVLVYGSFAHFGVFLVGEFLFALGMALTSGADTALIYDSLKERHQEKRSKPVLNMFASMMRVSIMVAAPVGSLIGAKLGLQYTMLFMAVPLSLSGLVALKLHEPPRAPETPSESKRYVDTLVHGVKYLFKHKIARLLILDSVPISALMFLLIWIYQPLLLQAGLDVKYFGFVHAGLSGAQVVIVLIYPRFEKMLASKQKYLFWVAMGCGLGFVALGLAPNALWVIVLTIVMAGFGLTRADVFGNYLQKHIPSAERATILSTVSMVRRLVIAILQPIFGICADWSLSWTAFGLGMLMIVWTLFSQVREEHLID